MLAHRGGRRYPLPFLLASFAWPWLHSDGQRQIPTPCLLFARLLSACPQTDSFEQLFCEFAWSLAPIDIRNSQFQVWNYFYFVLHIMFHLRFIALSHDIHSTWVNIYSATGPPPRSCEPPIPQDWFTPQPRSFHDPLTPSIAHYEFIAAEIHPPRAPIHSLPVQLLIQSPLVMMPPSFEMIHPHLLIHPPPAKMHQPPAMIHLPRMAPATKARIVSPIHPNIEFLTGAAHRVD